MRVIVPGGYYSYDSAGKKIWLDYQYYGTTLENIERIKNLTRNKILYDCKRSTVLPIVSNGCITHSYQGTEADADKIQITLRTPITNSLTELTPVDGVVTLETDGKVLVLPTANAAILPSFNQSVLDPNRLTIAESPFGGLKGSGSPDYAPGTLFCQTDGVYLTDTSGTNSTKTLTAGKLAELGNLTVDTTAHRITEEFIVANTATSNNPTVIDSCDSEDGWSKQYGTMSISSINGVIVATGTCDGKSFVVKKTLSLDLSSVDFLTFDISGSITGGWLYVWIVSSNGSIVWTSSRNTVSTIMKRYVLPLRAPIGYTTVLPSSRSAGITLNSVTSIYFGISGGVTSGAAYILSLDNITADTGKPAYIELQTPNNLAPSSLTTQYWTGTAYETVRTDSLDGAYSNVSIDTTKSKFLDGTLLDHVYGTGLGRAVFPKGVSGAEVTGSTGTMTYSANKGTSQRIGLMVSLPPSDGGRTDFNKIRLKTILTYAHDVEDNYSASYDFEDSTNASYGLQNLAKPWVALYDPADSLIDFYLFTHRPQNLSFKRNDDGTIHEVTLYPGNGLIYHGQITYANLTADSNSDGIPDCLEASVEGSITKFLQAYGMVI